MSNENELLEPLATEAGQLAIARAINNLGSLENAVRAERAAATATLKADEARNSAEDASDYATEARNWATKTDGYVAQETITIPPEQEGDDPTTETIDLYSARYYAALALDAYNNLQFDTEPTLNSTALVSSGAIYTALNSKADKSDTYTKTEVDTALSNVQSTLTFDNVPTANSDNPVKSSGIKTALDGKQDTLTFDSTPTANSNNPVTSGGVYTALQNVDIDVDTLITENSNNPVTSAAIYAALQNFTPSGGGSAGGIASGMLIVELWGNTSGWLSGEITLNDSYKNYDLIAFNYGIPNESPTSNSPILNSQIVAVQQLEDSKVGRMSIYGWGQRSTHFTITSDTKFNLLLRENNNTVYKIYGIKFSKNLSEQMYSNVLYENSSGWSSGSITLSDDFTNYDFIEFVYGEQNIQNQRYSKVIPSERLRETELDNKLFVIDGVDNQYILFSILSNSFTITSRINYQLYEIIGIKLAKGGYSGIVSDARMTVKSGTVEFTAMSASQMYTQEVTFDSPMPDANYEVIVSKGGFTDVTNYIYFNEFIDNSTKTVNGFTIKGWSTSNIPAGLKINWIAIRPNSYTREGMVEDVLFSNANGVNSGTINLSGNISDYDLIEVWLRGNNNQQGTEETFCTSSNSIITNGGFIAYGYSDRYISYFVVSDSSLSLTYNNGTKLYKIVGIKFGRYVSGVAVDTIVTLNSNAVVTSGAVYDALLNYTPSGGGGGGSITVDTTITENSLNPVTSAAIHEVLSPLLPSNFDDITNTDVKLNTANLLICRIYGRGYYKKYSDLAAGFITKYNTGNLTYIGVVLVSPTYNGAVGYCDYNSSTLSTPTSFVYDGTPLYYSTIPYGFYDKSFSDVSNNRVVIVLLVFGSLELAAQYLASLVFVKDNKLSTFYIKDAYTKTEVDTLIQNAGGGSSITVDSTITQGGTNPVEGGAIYTALDDKADKSTTYTKTEVDTALGSKQGTLTFDTTPTQNSSNPVTSGGVYTALLNLPTGAGDVTTNTDQNITGTKTFVGSKKVGFKLSAANDKLGFTLFGNTGTERGYLEFNPTNTIDGVAGLMTLGNYATSAASLTLVGFRRYSNISGLSGAYNLLMPMVADARTPFSLTTSYQNFYLPLGFTNGTTTVRTAKSGVVDLSPLLASLEARIAALEGN